MTTHRAPAEPVGADLTRLLKTLKIGALADTLPERAALVLTDIQGDHLGVGVRR
ncbi:MAG: hypothetical protein WBB57_00995 [Mycobacterium sp.]